jgi:hypothetical protein
MESGRSSDARTKVVYIGGYGRSGSTLLSQLLGEMPGVVAVGELFGVWSRNYVENQLCGCGLKFHDCPFWQDVTRRTFGGEPWEVPTGDLIAQKAKLIRFRHLPQLWLQVLRSSDYQSHLNEYSQILGRFYRSIQAVSGARIIADSSKEPSHAWILQSNRMIELHMVHLVRDSRAVTHSWRRKKVRPEVHWKVEHMAQYSVVRSSMEWNLRNALTGTHRNALASYTLLRYEDLVADPQSTLARIGDTVGEHWERDALPSGADMEFKTSHSASGNPIRFGVGRVQIKPDDEWVDQMKLWEKLTVTSLTAPGLIRFGYPLRQRSNNGTTQARWGEHR